MQLEKRERLEHLFNMMSMLIHAKHAGHRVEQELNKVITALMRELDLHHEK